MRRGLVLLLVLGCAAPAAAQQSHPFRAHLRSRQPVDTVRNPNVSITFPTQLSSWATAGPAFALSGVADDDKVLASGSITWECTTGTCTPDSGTASGTLSWAASFTIPCSGGGTTTVVTVTALDSDSLPGTDALTIVCTTPDTTPPTLTLTSPVAIPTGGSGTYSTSTASLATAATAQDDTALVSVVETCSTCTPTSRTCTITGNVGSPDTVTCAAVTLACSVGGTANTLVLTATDTATLTATVTLVATCTSADSTAPSITITSDCGGGAGGNCTVGSSPQTVSGTASDNVSVTSLTCRIGSGSEQTASFSAGPSVNWSITLAIAAGANVVTCTAKDQALNAATDTQTITLIADLQITSSLTLPVATVGTAYSVCLSSTGGVSPVTWSSLGEALPSGLTLTGSTGCIAGTPTTGADSTSPYDALQFRVTDSAGSPDTDTETFSLVVQAAGATTRNTYYDTFLKVSPYLHPVPTCQTTVPADFGACSLRSATQLDALANAGTVDQRYFGYFYPSSDTYASPQDGARLRLWGPTEAGNPDPSIADWPSSSKPRMDFATISSGTMTTVWDGWYGPEWRDSSCGGNSGFSHGDFKAFQHWINRIFWEVKFLPKFAKELDPGCTQNIVGGAGHRFYPSDMNLATSTSVVSASAIGMSGDTNPIRPCGKGSYYAMGDCGHYPIYASRWGRWIAHWEFDVPADSAKFNDWRSDCDSSGTNTASDAACAAMLAAIPDPDSASTWHLFTLWYCDEVRDCQRLMWRVPWHNTFPQTGTAADPNRWFVEMDKSGGNLRTGSAYSYYSNVAILKDYPMDMSGANSAADVTNNPNILKKPVP